MGTLIDYSGLYSLMYLIISFWYFLLARSMVFLDGHTSSIASEKSSILILNLPNVVMSGNVGNVNVSLSSWYLSSISHSLEYL